VQQKKSVSHLSSFIWNTLLCSFLYRIACWEEKLKNLSDQQDCEYFKHIKLTMALPSPTFELSRTHSKEISDPTFPSVQAYVDALGGNKVIDTILLANNGIAAVKVSLFCLDRQFMSYDYPNPLLNNRMFEIFRNLHLRKLMIHSKNQRILLRCIFIVLLYFFSYSDLFTYSHLLGNSLCSQMGLQHIWQRACNSIRSNGHSRRFSR
jgi:hypothetical protein